MADTGVVYEAMTAVTPSTVERFAGQGRVQLYKQGYGDFYNIINQTVIALLSVVVSKTEDNARGDWICD